MKAENKLSLLTRKKMVEKGIMDKQLLKVHFVTVYIAAKVSIASFTIGSLLSSF